MEPGILFLKILLCHRASGQPPGRVIQNFAEGTTFIKRPSIDALNVASWSVVGKEQSPGCERHLGDDTAATTTKVVKKSWQTMLNFVIANISVVRDIGEHEVYCCRHHCYARLEKTRAVLKPVEG